MFGAVHVLVAKDLSNVVELFDEEHQWITIDSRNPADFAAICR